MTCEKCGYKEKKEKENFGKKLCTVCNHFAPFGKQEFNKYINEKVDWKLLDTFRKFGQIPGQQQKLGMTAKAKQGKLVTRAPLGYEVVDGTLQPNQQAAKIHSLFKNFLEKNNSLNSFAKQYSLSVNGLKKILQNRTYLGEIKFAGNLHKGEHKPIISPEIFYAVQKKLRIICSTKKEDNMGE